MIFNVNMLCGVATTVLLSVPGGVKSATAGSAPADSSVQSISQASDSCKTGFPKFIDGLSIRSNALYDVMLAPNIEVEYGIDRDWSVGAGAWIAWLRHSKTNLWWQNYGVDIFGRYWFGHGHDARAQRGWHAGLYAGTFTYDVWTRGKGYQSPDMFKTYRIGAEIGWSTAIGNRWRLDISGGTGLLHTRQIVYNENSRGCYYIEQRRSHNLADFTRFGVTIGYRLGKDYINKEKGHER